MPEVASELEALLRAGSSPPDSPLNHLFKYMTFVNAIEPGRSKELSGSLQGSYRIYRYANPTTILYSSMKIFRYAAKQKTPFFVDKLIDESGSLRIAKGNIFRLDRDLIFVALIEKPKPAALPELDKAGNADKNHSTADYLTQDSEWIGMKMMIIPDPGRGSLDGKFGHCLFRSATEDAYDFGKVLVLQENKEDRVGRFKLSPPGPHPAAEALEEIRSASPDINIDDLNLVIDRDNFSKTLRFHTKY